MGKGLKLGTRGSPLAMAQAAMVAAALEAAHGWAQGAVEIVPITTSGDRIQDRPLADIGGKALWTKELDRVLLEGGTDLSVHSLKDVESVRPGGIRIAAVLPRADPRDRIIGAPSIAALKLGGVVGTSSPRRKAQLLSARPDLTVVPLRGNVGTRLAKLEGGEVEAMFLAAAGLQRLGMGGVGAPVPVEEMLPAPTQAVIAVERRAEDTATGSLLAAIDHAETNAAMRAERAFVAALGGTCHSPIGALARVKGGRIAMQVQLLSEDGGATMADEADFAVGDDEAPRQLARSLLHRAPASIRKLFEAA